jgi:hypothetical protein
MRPRVLFFGLLFALVASPARPAGFIESLSPAQKKQMGLDGLTPAQAAAVNDAVAHYQAGNVAALTQQAAASAVADYKAKQEPAIVARAVDVARQKQAEDNQERVAAHIRGPFKGWSGGTLFTLDNGQVWQQTGTEVYYLTPVDDAIVELRKAASGYHRLYLSDGRWITVKRVR